MLKHRIAKVAVSAAALIGTLAMAMPASAATYTWQKTCYNTWYGVRCSYRLVQLPSTGTTTATTPPVKTTATPAASTPTTTTTSPSAGLTANEQQMLNLVNAERSKLGILPLQADTQLTKLARMKSQDMISKNYFSHQSPTYGSPFDMLKMYGVSYKTAGENIAGNGSVSGAHTSLMNSSGHRANILNKAYTHVGIGIVDGGQYGKMFTQLFVGR
jgi:uncharacterized YkwD family protein